MFDLIEATAPAVVASFVSASNLQNYTITHDIAGGGIKTKYKRNMEAIKLLNQIESEGRVATPEEQRVLVEFVGWGGMPGVFDSKHKMYSPELFETLSESEYVAARRSTLNAHYTSLPVIDFMWSGLKRMGFNFGSVLEPAIGVGHFFGRMPLEMRDKSTLYGLDADGLSVRLAKQLYPLCAIINTKYQKYRSNIQFDVVASNIPFANIKISDPEIFHNGRGYLSGAGLHDYYFIKSLDLLRSGGLLAFITSRYTMDKADSVYRKYIASKSTLLGAVRLPSNAFKKNAHTETTMDILFFIKQPDPDPGWIDVERFNGGTDEQYFVNNYFAANPDHMIGEMKVNNRKFKGAAECVYAGDDFEAELHAKVENFPKDVYEQPVKHRPTKVSTGRTIGMEQSATYVQPKEKTWLREGSFAVDEWFRVWQKQGYAWVQLDYGKKASRTRDLCNLRDAFRLMLKANLDQVSDEEFAVHQNRLNVLYDSFVRSHGFINNRANSMVFKDDPDYYPMLALEKWDDETEKAIKQELFFNKRLDFYGAAATKAANAPDALAITLDQYGWVNFNHMIMLLELDADDESVVNGIVEELGDAIFENPKIDPETNGMHQWVTRDRYLSGNVRQKLEEAKRAGLKRNVVALVKVQPRDLVPREIVVRFGASFVPAKYIMQFVDDHMWKGKDTGLKITYHNGLGKWILDENDRNRWTVDNSTENTQEWGTPNVSAVTLIEKTLNKQSHTVYESYWDPSDGKEKRKPDQNATLAAQQKQESMKFAWTEWWKKDEKRAADISKIYNEGFNNYIPRQFDGSHLHFEGMNAAIELRSHQTDVVWRILQDPSTLMAHVVGAGKSFAMIAAAMKLKQLGISNKPVILVKKSTFPRILADAYLLYPNANILAAGSMPKNKRMYITGRIALEDWDIIVMTHEVFKSLNLTTETQMGFYREELAAIRLMLEEAKANADEPKKDPTVKQLENKLENIAAKMDDLRARSGKKDNGLFFEELGLDAIFYDECFKWETPILTEIGWLPIGYIVDNKLQLAVASVDLSTFELKWKPIVNHFKMPQHNRMVRVTHENGTIECTADHKIWTMEQGYVKAENLSKHHTLSLLPNAFCPNFTREAWEEVLSQEMRVSSSEREGDNAQGLRTMRPAIQLPYSGTGKQRKTSVLWQSLCDYVAQLKHRLQRQLEENGRKCPGKWCKRLVRGAQGRSTPANQGRYTSPDAPRCKAKVHRGQQEAQGKKLDRQTWRQWNPNPATSEVSQRVGVGRIHGVHHTDPAGQRSIRVSSQEVLCGHCRPISEVSHRGGWSEPQEPKMEILRPSQDGNLTSSRVVGIEVLELRSGQRLGEVRTESDYVYDIEVAENHNFLANGILVSNCQKIKNLYYPTTMSRIPGVGGSSESGIAFDSYMKFRWMDKNKEKPRLVFATGTPVENTLGEMYTLMRYMMYSELEVMGIHHFDAWAGVYGDEVTSVEMTPDGGDFHLKTRFAKFNNVPELLKLFWSFADVRMDRDKMGLDVPEVISGKPMGVTSPSSDVQTAVTAWLINRAANIDPRDKRSDNMLMVVGDARKCALDPRLLGPDKLSKAGIDYEIEDNPDSKVNKCVKNILGLYHNPSEHGLTQVVFLDLFQTDYMHLYHDIIDKLVAGGIKRNEIAIAQEQNTDDQRRKMQEQMQEGKLRVALGSTQTLGIGVNIQNKLIAAHMLDVPWKPAEYEQRMGRIVRQGNLNKEVYVYNYLTEKTFDVFMWETNQRKAKFIAQIFAGNLTVRTLEDIEAAVITYTEMAAMASGNPLVMEKVKVEADLVKYRSLEQQHSDSLGAMISRSHSLTGEIQMQKESLAAWGKLLDVIKQAGPDPLRELALKLYDLCMDVGDTHELVPIGQIYDMEVAYDNRVTVRQSVAKEFGIDTDKLAKSEEFMAALRAGVVENIHEYTKMVIKQKGGGDKAEEVLATAQLVVITGGPRYISFKLMVGRDDHAEKNLAKMENIFGQVAAEKFVASAEENLKESCIRLERYTEAATLPFEHTNVLRETEQRYYDIVAELDIAATKSKVPATGGDAPLPMAA